MEKLLKIQKRDFQYRLNGLSQISEDLSIMVEDDKERDIKIIYKTITEATHKLEQIKDDLTKNITKKNDNILTKLYKINNETEKRYNDLIHKLINHM